MSLFTPPAMVLVPSSGLPLLADPDLVLWIDVSNSGCWPGSGTTLTDLSGNGNDFTLTNVTVSTTNAGGSFYLDGVAANSTLAVMSTWDTYTVHQDYTIIGAYSLVDEGGSHLVGRAFSNNGATSNWLMGSYNWLGIGTPYQEHFYANGWISNPATAVDENWHIVGASYDDTAETMDFVDNNTVISDAVSATGNRGTEGLSLGQWVGPDFEGGGSEYSEIRFGFILGFDRVLSRAELTSIFNFYSGRYGL